MKYEICYNTNDQLWGMETIAENNGFTKTDDCYWVQIFRNDNGDSIVTTRADGELNHDPVDRLRKMLSPVEPIDENRSHCEYIAKTVEAYYNGDVYRCPDCGEVFTSAEAIDLDNDEIRCPNCENTSMDSEFEILGLWDYFDDYYNLEYRIESDRRTVRSVQIMVACGGPNIYIDTASKAVELYWWSDRADYPLSYEVCNAIDEMFQELWDMGC